MIFNKNMEVLKLRYLNAWEYITDRASKLEDLDSLVFPAKNGQPNIKLDLDGKTAYLHSQYNPENEAEQWIAGYHASVKEAKHVFFYGFGMGYHLDKLMRNSKIPYTIYEPNPSVFYNFMQTKLLSDMPIQKLSNVFIGDSADHYIRYYLENFTTDVLIIINPAYERHYPEQTKLFIDIFKEQIRIKAANYKALMGYERLWTYNSESNFKTVLNTQNVIREKKSFFMDKPVILVAAGPSLEDEFDNLRYIKENGLAYIFSVGSAIKALLAQDIYPDAVLSYDPNTYNHRVFNDIIDNKINTIPLIYGSSVGTETVKIYPGPMLHMFTSQDFISAYYLDEEAIQDATSIAILTLQLLAKLNVKTIVLVGQNFAIRNNQFYSKGISYQERPTELTDQERSVLINVESVDGGIAQTQEMHNLSRKQMEHFINAAPHVEVINSTKGGAAIKGTTYIELSEVIKQRLSVKVVEEDWFRGDTTSYDKEVIESRMNAMLKQHEEFGKMMVNIVKIIKKLEVTAHTFHGTKTAAVVNQISLINQELFENLYYSVYLKPMMRVQHDIFQKSLSELNSIENIIEKARAIVKIFGAFILYCQEVRSENESPFQSHIWDIKVFISEA
ncbi:DUF115 domain-containing protein [Paenibacillus psychroresistens]|uniref:DUF115 domain-containing protein n=1 Tax=Paenibacillus psychroresistens TaxID=1778678 RepID=A0A6B8RCC6_9BACL|nr:6-hydroxymethylpterin diphosphokinase MptE-like protein [Paenibacillus psychroresistens]QGQ93524.1 DUF115 domain-containing protein [Paenibacillus psychroresistens]